MLLHDCFPDSDGVKTDAIPPRPTRKDLVMPVATLPGKHHPIRKLALAEVVDAQQNVYNVGWDLSVALVLAGIVLNDGDPVTLKFSIGCDATSRTSLAPLLTGAEPGLDGHNRFESDSSLTRNDYFLAGGDNFSFNKTLFGMMVDTTGGTFDRAGIAKYRK